MNRSHCIILVLLTFIMCACESSRVHNVDGNIIFICDSQKVYQDTLYIAPEIPASPLVTSDTKEILSFRYVDKSQGLIPPVNEIKNDTITIPVHASEIIVSYNYNPVDKIEFIAQMGDTILLSPTHIGLGHNKPRTSSRMLDYDIIRFERYGNKYGWHNESLYNNPSILYVLSIINGFHMQAEMNEIKKKIHESYKEEKEWLDSLRTVNAISKTEHTYYSERLKYTHLTSCLPDLDREQYKNLIKNYSDSLYTSDSFGFYRSYMNALVYNMFYIKKVDVANGCDYDYQQVFNDICDNDILGGTIIDEHLFQCFRQIIHSSGQDVRDEYYNKSLAMVNDTTLLRLIKQEYERISLKERQYQSARLMDTLGKESSLEEILNKYKGKVIYCDIWASWCEPCRRELPYSIQLEKELSGQGVEFLYFAYNDKVDVWKKVISQWGQESRPNHYFISDPYHAQWVDAFQIETIPRYIVFDRSGNIVNLNAPSPSSSNIKEVLTNLL